MWKVFFITTALTLTTNQLHYIVSNSCNFEAKSYTCLTWEKFAENVANESQENVTLTIAPGKHCLNSSIQLYNRANVIINGQLDDGIKPAISCKQTFCFLLRNSSNIHIKNLVFTKCFNEDSYGGAILVSNGKLLHITQCQFVNNLIKTQGGVMRLLVIDRVYIMESQFVNNSAVCEPITKLRLQYCSRNCAAFSGAISSAKVSLLNITDSYFDSNTAPCYGGALASVYSHISLHKCKFTNSSTTWSLVSGGGGSVYIVLSSLEVFDSTFDENHSKFFGGGIFSEISTVDIQNCLFLFNSARYSGGAVYFSHTNLSISYSYFISNSASFAGGAANVLSISAVTNSMFLGNTVEY